MGRRIPEWVRPAPGWCGLVPGGSGGEVEHEQPLEVPNPVLTTVVGPVGTPANTCGPSGAAASDSTWASSTGANTVSTAPVVASKAKMLLRGMAVVGAPALATWVNWPSDDLVADLHDGGDLAVKDVRCPVRRVARHHHGLRDVHRGAGLRISPTRTAADTSAKRTRRLIWNDSRL